MRSQLKENFENDEKRKYIRKWRSRPIGYCFAKSRLLQFALFPKGRDWGVLDCHRGTGLFVERVVESMSQVFCVKLAASDSYQVKLGPIKG